MALHLYPSLHTTRLTPRRPAWFRLFVGDLSNDVSDDVLANAFNKYTSFTKARVIRDRLSQKVCTLCIVPLAVLISNDLPGQIWLRCLFGPRGFLKSLERNGRSVTRTFPNSMVLNTSFFRKVCWQPSGKAQEGRYDSHQTRGNRTQEGEAIGEGEEEQSAQALLVFLITIVY